MAWYYCAAAAHQTPVLLQSPFGAPPCTSCGAATAAAHDVVRFTHAPAAGLGYTVRWDDGAGTLQLKVVFTLQSKTYEVLLGNGVRYDQANFTVDTLVGPPAGGGWFDTQFPGYSGGTVGSNPPALPQGISQPKLKLGQHNGNTGYGLVHVFCGHRAMFGSMTSAQVAVRLTMDAFADNLSELTGPPTGQGKGIRKIGKQTNNQRGVLHGVAKTVHALLVIDQDGTIRTAYPSANLSGLGQAPVWSRNWH